jgi:succinate-acetate transporter protein
MRLANPSPLGLLGFGLTTVLFNMHNAGFFPLNTMVLAMGLAYGGLAQIIVRLMEFKQGNTFGTVAFTSYGLFWLSLMLLLIMPYTTFLWDWLRLQVLLRQRIFLCGDFSRVVFLSVHSRQTEYCSSCF